MNYIKIFKKIPPVVVVFIIVLISYGQTLQMTFWQDDAAVIFKLQHIEGPAGSYGAGPFGEGPYKYTITPFIPFFDIFGLNPLGYFLIGLLLYYIAAACIYLLAKELFSDKKAAFFTTLIFAAGYIGSNSLLKISNSWQNSIGLIISLLLFWSLARFFRKGQFKFYLLSLGLFLISAEFVYIRSHSLIFLILVLDVILGLFPFTKLKLFKMFLRQAPFWIMFYIFYLKNETLGVSALGSIVTNLLHGKLEVIATLFATTGYVFFPDILQRWLLNISPINVRLLTLVFFSLFSWILLSFVGARKITKTATIVIILLCFMLNKYFYAQNLYWYRNLDVYLSGSLGMYISVFLLALSFTLWPKYKSLALGIVFGLIYVISQIFGYFMQYPEATFDTTHRYLYYSFVGYSLILGSITSLSYLILKSKDFSKKYMFIPLIPIFFVVIANSLLSFNYQNEIVAERSKPTQNFYQVLKREVPKFEKGSIFYFDIAANLKSQTQFRDFFSVGSMPETTAIAIYYNVDRYDLTMVTEYEELLSTLSKNKTPLNNLYTFYFDSTSGLINTSNQSRTLFDMGSNNQNLKVTMNSPSYSTLISDNLLSLSPILLDLQLKVLPNISELNYPYSQNPDSKKYSHEDKNKMIQYLLSRLNYYKHVSTNTLSEWKSQEKNYLIDNNTETSWRGHRIYWHDNQHEQITIDLGEFRNINKVLWINWIHTLTPTEYMLSVSLDGRNWLKVKEVQGEEKKDGQLVEDYFASTQARFVRMDITKTLSNDAPAISEFEVINSNDVSAPEALSFIQDPFNGIKNQQEIEELFSKVAPLLHFSVDVTTDKQTISKQVAIGQFNATSNFSIILKPGGRKVKEIKILIPFLPLKLQIESASAKNLNLEETERLGAIKNFKEN